MTERTNKNMINGVAADYLNINDRAIHYGDGIFETVLCSNNSLYFWQQHYLRLKTSAEKQQFIDRWLTMMEMAHGGRERARKEFQEKGPFAKDRQPPTPEQRNKVIAEYRKNLPLIMSRTSAEDRSKMVNLARDSMQRIRERYGPDSSP